jgi:IS30 family transposase
MAHLSYEQRYTIEILLQAGEKKSSIAEKLKVDKSVICREILRNCDGRNWVYKAKLAQQKYEGRMKSKPKAVKFDQELKETVKQLLEEDYSPEQISGVLKKRGGNTISHEVIYLHIWDDKKRKGSLYTHLRRNGRRYRKRVSNKDSRGKIVGRVGIERRPHEAEGRAIFGHLETDTIIGKNHQGAIITLNDRASGMLWMGKVESRDAETVRIKLCYMLNEIRPFIKSITADNGKEFSEHQYITDEYCDFFFANPYSPWERGSNENLNGLVRQYIPKRTDFSTISEKRIKEIETKINNRPRKRYNYESPIFVMEKLLFNPEVAFVT